VPSARKGLVEDEDIRAGRLLDAQARAAELFAAIEPRGIIAPGVREVEASDAIRDMAADLFGVDRHWHKRIVRAGPNTLQPYRRLPRMRTRRRSRPAPGDPARGRRRRRAPARRRPRTAPEPV